MERRAWNLQNHFRSWMVVSSRKWHTTTHLLRVSQPFFLCFKVSSISFSGRVPYGNAPSSDTRQKMTKRQQNIGRRENGELDDEGDDDYSRKESGRKSRSRSNSSRRKTRSRIGGGGGNGKGRTRSRRSLRRNNININSQRSSSWSGGNKARSKQQQQQHQQQKPPPLSRQLSPLPSPSRMGLVSFEGRGGGERRRRSRRRRRHRCSGEEKAESGGEREGSLDPGRHPWCRPCSSSSSRNDLQLWHVSARALFSLAADYLRHNSKVRTTISLFLTSKWSWVCSEYKLDSNWIINTQCLAYPKVCRQISSLHDSLLLQFTEEM